METKNDKLKGINKTLLETKKPDEFIGTCISLQQYTSDTLDDILSDDLINMFIKMFVDDKELKRFAFRDNINAQVVLPAFEKICLDTLSVFITSNIGFQMFNKQLNNNSANKKLFINKLQQLHDSKETKEINIELIVSVCVFLANMCIFEPNNIDVYGLKYIVGDNKFSCLDTKNEKILYKKTMLAYNYYSVGTTIDKIHIFLTQIENRKSKLSKKILQQFYNLIMTSMKCIKNTCLSSRAKKLIK